MSESCTKYVIFSKKDNQEFKVNQKIIDASVLLKNICDLTEVSEPIVVDCLTSSLDIYIKLIDHYETINDQHDLEFEETLFKNFTDDELIELVQNICILDSDFFMDSVADFILNNFKEMDWKDMQAYLGLENDFTENERARINEFELEYLLSISNHDSLKLEFPFPDKSFVSLKTRFYSPMNVLLAKIVKRSKDEVAFNLSLINTAMKNENDRFPIKLSSFRGSEVCLLQADYKDFALTSQNEEYFEVIKERKIIADEFSLQYSAPASKQQKDVPAKCIILCSSLDFCIPPKNAMAEIHFQEYKEHINYFDIKSCPFRSVTFIFSRMKLEFEFVYENLIKKDLSKYIEVMTGDVFDFFACGGCARLFKRPDSLKFYECHVFEGLWMEEPPLPKFKEFLKKFMEEDSVIMNESIIRYIPAEFCKKERERCYIYKMSEIYKFL